LPPASGTAIAEAGTRYRRVQGANTGEALRAAVASLGKPTLHLPDRAAAAES